VGLNADLSHLTGFRIEFATDFASGAYGALDLDTAGGIAVWTNSGTASVPLGITAGSTEKYVPFADLRGEVPPDWQHVQEIAIVIESGGIVPAHDYVLRSISAVAQQ